MPKNIPSALPGFLLLRDPGFMWRVSNHSRVSWHSQSTSMSAFYLLLMYWRYPPVNVSPHVWGLMLLRDDGTCALACLRY